MERPLCSSPLQDLPLGYRRRHPRRRQEGRRNELWLPDPDKDSATKLTFEHSPNLTVYHKPGHLVNTSCYTADDCPWPKQLFFREKVEVQLTESVTWDLVKYPFDKQRLRAKVIVEKEMRPTNPRRGSGLGWRCSI